MNKNMVLRSVRKSIKDYLIYMLTLILCVSLFYAFLSISSKYYKPMVGEQYDITILSDGMKMIICVITCLIVFSSLNAGITTDTVFLLITVLLNDSNNKDIAVVISNRILVDMFNNSILIFIPNINVFINNCL